MTAKDRPNPLPFHEYGPYTPDLTRDPVETLPGGSLLGVRREDLPEVHTVEVLPHIHVTDSDGEESAIHTLPGDTARELIFMGFHYLALGLAMREELGMAWDQKWTGPGTDYRHAGSDD